MLAIKGIYDGTVIKPLEPIPFKKGMEVIITFLQEYEINKEKDDWRKLRGSAKGTGLTAALLRSRREDLERE
jgi:predicted DNA-binding antitoxin AbrB/MazE fold protein